MTTSFLKGFAWATILLQLWQFIALPLPHLLTFEFPFQHGFLILFRWLEKKKENFSAIKYTKMSNSTKLLIQTTYSHTHICMVWLYDLFECVYCNVVGSKCLFEGVIWIIYEIMYCLVWFMIVLTLTLLERIYSHWILYYEKS